MPKREPIRAFYESGTLTDAFRKKAEGSLTHILGCLDNYKLPVSARVSLAEGLDALLKSTRKIRTLEALQPLPRIIGRALTLYSHANEVEEVKIRPLVEAFAGLLTSMPLRAQSIETLEAAICCTNSYVSLEAAEAVREAAKHKDAQFEGFIPVLEKGFSASWAEPQIQLPLIEALENFAKHPDLNLARFGEVLEKFDDKVHPVHRERLETLKDTYEELSLPAALRRAQSELEALGRTITDSLQMD